MEGGDEERMEREIERGLLDAEPENQAGALLDEHEKTKSR